MIQRCRAPKLDGAWIALALALAAIAVFALVRRKVFGWYLTLALLGSTAAGFLYQFALSW